MRLGAVVLVGVLLTGVSGAQSTLLELVQQLGSDDRRQRTDAYRALQRDRSPQIVGLIAKRIDSFPRVGQELSCNLLRMFPIADTSTVYKQLTAAESAYLRVVGAARLVPTYVGASARARRQRAIKVIAAALAACEADRIMNAVLACRQVVDPPVLAQLRAFLTPDTTAHVATGLLRELLLRERGTSKLTAQAVASLLTSSKPRVKAVAYAYLLRDDPSHGKPLAELLKEKPGVLWWVRDQLPTNKLGEAVIEAIAAGLMSPRSEHDIPRLAVILRQRAPHKLKVALRGLLGHEKEKYREVALKQLASMPGGLNHKDLMEMLQGDALPARIVAAATLRRRDNHAGLDVVLAAAKATGKYRVDAARALSDFRSKKAIPVLLDLLDAQDRAVRTVAWQGLQKTLRSIYPYRKFDFRGCDYDPNQGSRATAIATLRAWWAEAK